MLELVENAPQYHEFMRLLRNNVEVQDGFLEFVTISPEQQKLYMQRYESRYFICLLDQQPCGYIGDIDGDIRVCVDPAHQGRGVASFMLQEFLQRRPECTARVKPDNHASLRLFEKAGFRVKWLQLAPPPPTRD